MSAKEEFQFAREIQIKYDFYFIGLIFTLLGLSIQTSVFTKFYLQNVLELISWVFLTISGAIGLSRLEWTSVIYRQFGELKNDRDTEAQLSQNLDRGPFVDSDTGKILPKNVIQDDIKILRTRITQREEETRKIDTAGLMKYKFQKYLFLISLITLILSRFLTKTF